MTTAPVRRALTAAALSTGLTVLLALPAAAQQAQSSAPRAPATFVRNHDRSNFTPVRNHDRSNLPAVRNHDRSNLPPWWPQPRNHDRSNLAPIRGHDRSNLAAATAASAADAPDAALVRVLTSRGNDAARPRAEALVAALAELPEQPERLSAAVDAFNALVDASSPAFLSAPPAEFTAIRGTLADFSGR